MLHTFEGLEARIWKPKSLKKIDAQIGMNFGRHVYGFWLHFGGHFGGQKLQQSMPKLNEKKDVILESMFSLSARGRRKGWRPWGLIFGKK